MSYAKITGLTWHQAEVAKAVATAAENPGIVATATTLTFETSADCDQFRAIVVACREKAPTSTAFASVYRKVVKAKTKADTTCPPSIAKHLEFLAN